MDKKSSAKRWKSFISREQALTIAERCKRGEYFCTVGKEFKLSPTQVIALLIDLGYGEYYKWKHYGIKGKSIRWTEEKVLELRTLYNAGYNDDEIAQALRSSGQAISRARSTHKIVLYEVDRKKGIHANKVHDRTEYTASNQGEFNFDSPTVISHSAKTRTKDFDAVIDLHLDRINPYAKEICDQLEKLTWKDVLASEISKYPSQYMVTYLMREVQGSGSIVPIGVVEPFTIKAYYRIVHIDLINNKVEFTAAFKTGTRRKTVNLNKEK